jgi:transcriptional regulator with XRE-family HTH domain
MNVVTRVAHNIRRIRVSKDLSQEGLAFASEVDRAYLGRVERAMENPTVKVLERVAKVLGVDVSELVVEPATRARPGTLWPGRKTGKRR